MKSHLSLVICHLSFSFSLYPSYSNLFSAVCPLSPNSAIRYQRWRSCGRGQFGHGYCRSLSRSGPGLLRPCRLLPMPGAWRRDGQLELVGDGDLDFLAWLMHEVGLRGPRYLGCIHCIAVTSRKGLGQLHA